MVKLATAREGRLYGPRLSRNRSEYMNAGLYVFASIVLLCGFAAQFSNQQVSGLVLMLISLIIIVIVNLHDLIAHLALARFRLGLVKFDVQLGVVEFGVPFLHTLGTLLYFLAILFILLQEEKGYGYMKIEKHALNLIIAGAALWLVGSILNSCQIYERADGHIQILQQSVHIPLLMGSLIFLVAAITNIREQFRYNHGLDLLGERWKWMGIFGSLMFIVGGITNVLKVFKMQQMDNGMRLEKLRGGAQDREGVYAPFVREDPPSRRHEVEEARFTTMEPPPQPPPYEIITTPASTPYKDVLTDIITTPASTPYKDVLTGKS